MPEIPGEKVAVGVVDALKSTPVLLAILIFNIALIGVNAWQTHTARAQFMVVLHDIMETCRDGVKR